MVHSAESKAAERESSGEISLWLRMNYAHLY
jgi:hypothetical protein